MEVPRLGAESEVQLRPMPQPQQYQILNPLHWAAGWTSASAEKSQIINPLHHSGNSQGIIDNILKCGNSMVVTFKNKESLSFSDTKGIYGEVFLGEMVWCLWLFFKIIKPREFPGGPAVKDLALSLLWLRFDPWPRNFHICSCSQKSNNNQAKAGERGSGWEHRWSKTDTCWGRWWVHAGSLYWSICLCVCICVELSMTKNEKRKKILWFIE